MTTRFTALVLCGMLASCRSITTTQTGSKYGPRSPDCKFTMLTKPPESGFAEIGAVKVESGATGGNSYADLVRFKNEIRSYVCEAGGDAAVALTSDSGVFVAATILKQNEAPTAKKVAKAPPEAVSAPAKAADAGCQEDEQCEGDLLCIDGKCAPRPAPPLEPPPLEQEQAAPAAQEESGLVDDP